MTDDGGQKSLASDIVSDDVFLSRMKRSKATADFRRPSSVYCHPILRKEVIQPQVPLRLPCYDFTPVAEPTVAGCPLAVGAPS
jgi:hypothetical protein